MRHRPAIALALAAPLLTALALSAPLLTAGAAAQDLLQGDAAAGERLALTVCARCHVVAERQPHPNPPAPGAVSFFELAARNEVTPLWLRAFFRTPHQAMPNLVIQGAEADNLIAYIMSLKPGMRR